MLGEVMVKCRFTSKPMRLGGGPWVGWVGRRVLGGVNLPLAGQALAEAVVMAAVDGFGARGKSAKLCQNV
jgi:hypothetical protein